jgi:hypothetical protein
MSKPGEAPEQPSRLKGVAVSKERLGAGHGDAGWSSSTPDPRKGAGRRVRA